ncbi:hypothetical protein ACO0M4_15815 [Streptomyces sp. RGM 3693]|uniref:hypothetical protein n=1 Tax=Streptomyces sp. RGM 3693 TaxID=3413284 RepID=UPI003D2D4DA2
MIRITGAGRTWTTGLAPAVLAVNGQILADFSPEEREQFLTLLRRAVEGAPATTDSPAESGHDHQEGDAR